MPPTPRVLFVCAHRGGRSQVAAAYARQSAGIDAEAASLDKGGVSQDFQDLIASLGLNIDRQSPKSIFEFYGKADNYDRIVSLCGLGGTEMCEVFRDTLESIFQSPTKLLNWNIPDFQTCQKAPEGFKECVKARCLEIERHVNELVKELAQTA